MCSEQASSNNYTNTTGKPRVAYFTVSSQNAGQGHISRTLAVREALSRANYLDKIDLWLVGIPDAPSLWPDQNSLLIEPNNSYNPEHLSSLVASLKPDLLIVDTYLKGLIPLYTCENCRPPAVWALCRYMESGYLGIPYGSLDRLYQTEAFQVPAQFYRMGICREWCRSLNEKAEIAKQPYKAGDGNDWYVQNFKADRKLIPPVVNVWPDKVYSRQEARQMLLEAANIVVDNNKPLVLVTGRPSNCKQIDLIAFDKWLQPQLDKLGNLNDDYLLVKFGLNTPPLPEIYRYMSGCNYIFAAAGSMFNEIRYLKQLELFLGEANFFPLMHTAPDQEWRGEKTNQTRLMLNQSYPIGNGATYLAEAIARKLKITDNV